MHFNLYYSIMKQRKAATGTNQFYTRHTTTGFYSSQEANFRCVDFPLKNNSHEINQNGKKWK